MMGNTEERWGMAENGWKWLGMDLKFTKYNMGGKVKSKMHGMNSYEISGHKMLVWSTQKLYWCKGSP